MREKKNFVLDTNVILHDFKCIHNFHENDIYLPMTVIEELDRFKKGNEQINFNARQFAREIDEIVDSKEFFKKGASLGEGKGRIYVITENHFPEALRHAFMEKKADHYILGAAMYVGTLFPKMKTVLVTKDLNLRMKSRSLGVEAEDYFSDKVVHVDRYEQEHALYDEIDPSLIDNIYSSQEGVPLEQFPFRSDVDANECFVLKCNRSSVLARYFPEDKMVRKVEKQRCFGIEPRNAEQTFAMNVLLDDSVKLVAVTGRAGTGKTLLALAAGLARNEVYEQIMLARPVVTLANKDMGALPGDAKGKVAPYMQPLFDNLNVVKHALGYAGKDFQTIEAMQREGRMIIEALAFIRGRSLSNTYFIIDEAQNLTPHEIKTIITRAGEGTKIVFTGDIHQIDAPYLDKQSNGLVYMIDRLKGQDMFAHVNLLKGERSELSEIASKLL